jgi:DNA-binding LacI/PurR family transcriptional regulator
MNILKDDSSTVKFRELARVLKTKIESGEYGVGDTIPSETELENTFDVSRITVRNAINLLVNDGLLKKQRGRGKGTMILEPQKDADKLRKGLSFGSFFSVNWFEGEKSDMPEVIQGIIKKLNIWEASINLLPFVPEIDQAEYVKSVIDRNLMDGLFVWPLGEYTRPVIEFLTSINHPFVLLDSTKLTENHELYSGIYPTVIIDEQKGVDNLLCRASANGYQKISVIGFEDVEYRRTCSIFAESRAENLFEFDNVFFSDNADCINQLSTFLKKIKGEKERLIVVGSKKLMPYLDAGTALLKLEMPKDISVIMYEHYGYSGGSFYERYSILNRPFRRLGELAAELMKEVISAKLSGRDFSGGRLIKIDAEIIDHGTVLV